MMKLICLLLAATTVFAAKTSDITWLLHFDGTRSPQAQGWQPVGAASASATVVEGALRIRDTSTTEAAGFRASWTPDPARELVIEARARVESVSAGEGRLRIGQSEGAPAALWIGNGRFQEGLVLRPDRITNFLDRVVKMDARKKFHTYRLEILGNDMKVFVDGELKMRGEGAFWKAATSPEGFVQFGSTSAPYLGESHWASIRLGIRQAAAAPRKSKLRITVSESWDIPPAPGTRHTRPFVHDVGQGILLMSAAQGSDAWYEPYGVLKSTDQGRTWQPFDDLQLKTFGPQAFVRRPEGEILGVSRWTFRYALRGESPRFHFPHEDGVYLGMSYRFDPRAERFAMYENTVRVPKGMGFTIIFNRDIFDLGDGSVLASVYCPTVDGNGRRSFLLKSADGGKNWEHYSTLGEGPEPSVARLSATEFTALLRNNPPGPFLQTWSRDQGKTWSPPVSLEVGSVDPDMTLMSHGVLACSYGRPGSNLMFSLDGGRTWGHHTVITEERGFNYTAIREVRPGRLLYVHDAPRMRAVYVDVERVE